MNNCAAFIPEGSDKSREGERSNIELGEARAGRVCHWCVEDDGIEGADIVVFDAVGADAGEVGGTNAQAWLGST